MVTKKLYRNCNWSDFKTEISPVPAHDVPQPSQSMTVSPRLRAVRRRLQLGFDNCDSTATLPRYDPSTTYVTSVGCCCTAT